MDKFKEIECVLNTLITKYQSNKTIENREAVESYVSYINNDPVHASITDVDVYTRLRIIKRLEEHLLSYNILNKEDFWNSLSESDVLCILHMLLGTQSLHIVATINKDRVEKMLANDVDYSSKVSLAITKKYTIHIRGVCSKEFEYLSDVVNELKETLVEVLCTHMVGDAGLFRLAKNHGYKIKGNILMEPCILVHTATDNILDGFDMKIISTPFNAKCFLYSKDTDMIYNIIFDARCGFKIEYALPMTVVEEKYKEIHKYIHSCITCDGLKTGYYIHDYILGLYTKIYNDNTQNKMQLLTGEIIDRKREIEYLKTIMIEAKRATR